MGISHLRRLYAGHIAEKVRSQYGQINIAVKAISIAACITSTAAAQPNAYDYLPPAKQPSDHSLEYNCLISQQPRRNHFGERPVLTIYLDDNRESQVVKYVLGHDIDLDDYGMQLEATKNIKDWLIIVKQIKHILQYIQIARSYVYIAVMHDTDKHSNPSWPYPSFALHPSSEPTKFKSTVSYDPFSVVHEIAHLAYASERLRTTTHLKHSSTTGFNPRTGTPILEWKPSRTTKHQDGWEVVEIVESLLPGQYYQPAAFTPTTRHTEIYSRSIINERGVAEFQKLEKKYIVNGSHTVSQLIQCVDCGTGEFVDWYNLAYEIDMKTAVLDAIALQTPILIP